MSKEKKLPEFKTVKEMLQEGYCMVIVPEAEVEEITKGINAKSPSVRKKQKKKSSTIADRILQVVSRRKTPYSNKELAAKLGCDEVVSSATVKKLVESGKLAKIRNGRTVEISIPKIAK